MPSTSQSHARHHPLDQLTAAEIERTVSLLRGHSRFPGRAFFRVIGRKEPSRSTMRAFDGGGEAPPRLAYSSVFDRDRGRAIEAMVDLDADTVVSFELADARCQPGISPAEQAAANARVRADPRWQKAMRAREPTLWYRPTQSAGAALSRA